MVAYETSELIPSSEFAKKFGSYLAKIKEKSVNKLAILKNNRIEAVLVSKDEYEKMQKALRLVELAEFKKSIANSFDEAELIKSGKKKAYHIDTLWDEI